MNDMQWEMYEPGPLQRNILFITSLSCGFEEYIVWAGCTTQLFAIVKFATYTDSNSRKGVTCMVICNHIL